ncbi:hypothetical protein RRG08_066686 [Elysia crispata]|uniref:Reverse transcriptase domain-containing protein n=1 Tax=Elysia crispata TaxID=231223 RepID=A0AAE0Z3G1_9GAST|nr:hypothetical protein RRG08_066686 [Elysia crispata]
MSRKINRNLDKYQTPYQENESETSEIKSQRKKDRMKAILKLLGTPELGAERRTMLQREIDDIEEEKYRGAAVRCKIDTEQEDIPTQHFLTREQNVQKSRAMKEIRKKIGELTNKQEEIKKEFREFYKKLYTEEGQPNEDKQEEYTKYVRKIEEGDREDMDHPFTENEIESGPKQKQILRTRWTHQRVLPNVPRASNPHTKKVVDQALERGRIPEEMKLSYITLLSKDEKNRTEVSKYKSVSLLNTEYKVISNILKSRLKVMHKLVHKDQQCAVKGRKIQNHLHNIREIITYCKVKETPARIISLDQEKAFYRVSHSFLHKVMEARNLEPLLDSIRQDPEIKGIEIPGGGEQKSKAFADGIMMLVTENKAIERIIRKFQDFGKARGRDANKHRKHILTTHSFLFTGDANKHRKHILTTHSFLFTGDNNKHRKHILTTHSFLFTGDNNKHRKHILTTHSFLFTGDANKHRKHILTTHSFLFTGDANKHRKHILTTHSFLSTGDNNKHRKHILTTHSFLSTGDNNKHRKHILTTHSFLFTGDANKHRKHILTTHSFLFTGDANKHRKHILTTHSFLFTGDANKHRKHILTTHSFLFTGDANKHRKHILTTHSFLFTGDNNKHRKHILTTHSFLFTGDNNKHRKHILTTHSFLSTGDANKHRKHILTTHSFLSTGDANKHRKHSNNELLSLHRRCQ